MELRELKAMAGQLGLSRLCREGRCGYDPDAKPSQTWQGIDVGVIESTIGYHCGYNATYHGCPFAAKHRTAEAIDTDAAAEAEANDSAKAEYAYELKRKAEAKVNPNREPSPRPRLDDAEVTLLIKVYARFIMSLGTHFANSFGLDRETLAEDLLRFTDGSYATPAAKLLWCVEWCERRGLAVESQLLTTGESVALSVVDSGELVEVAIDGMDVGGLHESPERPDWCDVPRGRASLCAKGIGNEGIATLYRACRTLDHSGAVLQRIRQAPPGEEGIAPYWTPHKSIRVASRFVLPTGIKTFKPYTPDEMVESPLDDDDDASRGDNADGENGGTGHGQN